MELLERAARRRRQAEAILDDLRLFEKWRRFGRPVLVGAVSFDLAVAPDIDMEVYCPELRIEHGFQVLAECALHPRIVAVNSSMPCPRPTRLCIGSFDITPMAAPTGRSTCGRPRKTRPADQIFADDRHKLRD